MHNQATFCYSDWGIISSEPLVSGLAPELKQNISLISLGTLLVAKNKKYPHLDTVNGVYIVFKS